MEGTYLVDVGTHPSSPDFAAMRGKELPARQILGCHFLPDAMVVNFSRPIADADRVFSNGTNVTVTRFLSLEHSVSSSPDFDVKDRVKQATDIVDLTGRYMTLRRQGANYVGLCPWHQDTRPSFQINPTRQSWACWVCGIRGDVFDFVMRRESVDFRAALEILAGYAGIEITRAGKAAIQGSADHKPTLYDAMQWAQSQYHECLLTSPDAAPIRDYLNNRGMDREAIDTFKLGFAPLSWTWLVDRVGDTPYTAKILEACGLIGMSQRGSWYERFRGRVLFPIRDTQHRTIAFGGRVVPGIYGTEEEPRGKYVNSPESRLFSKSDHLFGLDLVRDEVSRTRQLTIVEGYTDVIAAWQAGLRNVVAALGTALNDRHIKLIKRFADQITLVLDGDEAGQTRMNQVLDLFVQQDVDLRIMSLPDGMDPCDFVQKNGRAAFEQRVSESPDAISHRIRTATEGVDLVNETHAANQALENILKTLANIPASTIASSAAKSLRQDQLITRLARQFRVDRDRIRQRLFELRTSTSVIQKNDDYGTSTQPIQIDYSKFENRESELLQLLMLNSSFLDQTVERVSPEQFRTGMLKELYIVMDDFYHEGRELTYDSLMLSVEDPAMKNVIDYLYEIAEAKRDANSGDRTMVQLDHQGQLESVLAAFDDFTEHQGKQATLSKLMDRELESTEEESALLELLKQSRQRQGL